MVKLQRLAVLVTVLMLVAGCGLGADEGVPTLQSEAQPTMAVADTAVPTKVPDEPTEPPPTEPTAPPPTPTTPSAPTEEPALEPTDSPKAAEPSGPKTAVWSPVVAEIVADLEGLTVDQFFEESYKQLLLRSPQTVTYLGLSNAFGMGNDQLDDLSDTYIRDTQQLQAAILDLLRTYDRATLSPGQQVTYDVYEWYLDDLVRGHQFMYHDFPVHHFLSSYDDELVRLFAEIHPIEDEQDAQDYVSRLSGVDDQVDQLLEGLRIREGLGIIPPRDIVAMAINNLYNLANSPARATPFYAAFAEKVGVLDGLGEEQVQALLVAAEAEIDGSVLPAFRKLAQYMESLRAAAPVAFGAWQYPDGDAYYAYLLRQQTSTDLTPDEVHELGLVEVARIQGEMRQVFGELGYPPQESLGESMNRAIEEGGFYDIRDQAGKQRMIEALEEMLDEVDRRLDEVVDIHPTADVIVAGDPGFTGGGYYVSASLDGSRPGAFHTGIGGASAPKFNMPTTAYHEAIPGHHFQIAIAQELDLPLLRNDVFFNGYAEGWALYAERLAYELGLYEDDPYGNLGRLQLELLRAVRLVADTGIHARQWTRQEAKAYMNEALGDPSGRWSHEVERYTVYPAQATGYKIGMLKILELRQRAMDALGDRFDIKEFHNVILGNGAMPLELLERAVEDYIVASSGASGELPAGDGAVEGWAVLAEKDDYDDVGMTNLPVGYIGVEQMRQALQDAGWEADQIHELREFDQASLLADLDWLATNADEDDVVVLYVAAHGRYLQDVMEWATFFPGEWAEIASDRRLLVIDACQAANYTGVIAGDPAPYLAIAAVDGDEYAWSGLEEEGLPIIGGVFTHYFAAAFDDLGADADGNGLVSAQEAAILAELQQRAYMHDVVFAVDEFVESYHEIGAYPDQDPEFPDVVLDDTIGEPLYLELETYP